MNRVNYGLAGILLLSAFLNFHFFNQKKNHETMILLMQEKEGLQNQQVQELTLVAIRQVNDNLVETARNSGRIEGILDVIANKKPSESEYSSVWHAGYYQGLSQEKPEITNVKK